MFDHEATEQFDVLEAPGARGAGMAYFGKRLHVTNRPREAAANRRSNRIGSAQD